MTRPTVDGIAGEFLNSSYAPQPTTDGWLSTRLADYLRCRHLDRLVVDRDVFDLLVNRVMELRARRRR